MNSIKLQDTKLIQRNLLYSYTLTKNERSEREIKETIPFTITSKRIKYLDVRPDSIKLLEENTGRTL